MSKTEKAVLRSLYRDWKEIVLCLIVAYIRIFLKNLYRHDSVCVIFSDYQRELRWIIPHKSLHQRHLKLIKLISYSNDSYWWENKSCPVT